MLADLYDQMKATPVHTDLADLWRRLGIEVKDGVVRYNDKAPLAKNPESHHGPPRALTSGGPQDRVGRRKPGTTDPVPGYGRKVGSKCGPYPVPDMRGFNFLCSVAGSLETRFPPPQSSQLLMANHDSSTNDDVNDLTNAILGSSGGNSSSGVVDFASLLPLTGSGALSQIDSRDGLQPSSLAASTTAEPRQRVFSAASVAWCFDHVAATVAGLIRLEMIECLRTTRG